MENHRKQWKSLIYLNENYESTVIQNQWPVIF